jgi:dimethylhistidine N-methyltransferase
VPAEPARGAASGARASEPSGGALLAPLGEPGDQTQQFLQDVCAGLRGRPPRIPAKYLYDERGSQLFDEICDLDVYYLTRTELAILEKYAGEMSERIGAGCLLIEYGSGSSIKTRVLLKRLEQPAGYVPIDISREHLLRSAQGLAQCFRDLPVLPVCGDYTRVEYVPEPEGFAGRRVMFFPGSTIGNLEPAEAVDLLRRVVRMVGRGGGLLIGVDLHKDSRALELAYDDPQGVTARFELNVLTRINRELGGDFDLSAWSYRARYNTELRCIEMEVVSRAAQSLRVGAERFRFAPGESILTERSYKYTAEGFSALARRAGWRREALWTDPEQLFSVQFFRAP